MKSLGVVVTWLCLILFFGSVSAQCPNGFTTYNGDCYKAINHVATWADAHHYCVKLGASLLQVRNSAENEWVINWLLGADSSFGDKYWIDVNDMASEGTWVWEVGIPAAFFDWAPGQPDNAGGVEHCASISRTDGGWNDIQCNSNYNFVCQIIT